MYDIEGAIYEYEPIVNMKPQIKITHTLFAPVIQI